MAAPSQILAIPEAGRATDNSHRGDVHINDVAPGPMTTARFLLLAPIILFLVALSLLGAGAASLLRSTAQHDNGDSLLVNAHVKSFEDAPSGARVPVRFVLTNRSAQPIRAVGATLACGVHGCLTADNLPLEIPPSSVRNLVVYVETGNPGQFASGLTLFSDAQANIRFCWRSGGGSPRMLRSPDAGEGPGHQHGPDLPGEADRSCNTRSGSLGGTGHGPVRRRLAATLRS